MFNFNQITDTCAKFIWMLVYTWWMFRKSSNFNYWCLLDSSTKTWFELDCKPICIFIRQSNSWFWFL